MIISPQNQGENDVQVNTAVKKIGENPIFHNSAKEAATTC